MKFRLLWRAIASGGVKSVQLHSILVLTNLICSFLGSLLALRQNQKKITINKVLISLKAK